MWHTAPPARVLSLKRLPAFSPRVMAMLFADVVHSSQLTELEIPRFVQHFLGMVAELATTSPHAPVMKNTWGDGLFFVFPSVRDAGLFALELCDQVQRTPWREKGLSRNMELRIGLHAGPIYQFTDPVTDRINYTGTHVIHAARIVPITPSNQVYASAPFAALASAERVSDFMCEYVGQTPLARGHGTFRTYHVHQRSR